MISSSALQLAGVAAEHGRTFLGEPYAVWRVAAILAVVAAVAYEWATALTRMISLRLPFLLLYMARLSTPKSEWPSLYRAWKGELHAILNRPRSFWLLRTLQGLMFAAPLAFGAARITGKESAPEEAGVPSRVKALAQYLDAVLALLASCVGVVITTEVSSDQWSKTFTVGMAILLLVGGILQRLRGTLLTSEDRGQRRLANRLQ
ncbi:hypothetical protein ACIOHS_35385 [Streptomyces sp. NPDC088253]|uniref:hypothetical protein n=1 Tax=Streptomyces sp. NPDC088253 TaxID=3365846 RepID=UPI0038216DBC